jgi:hypothetical protein
MITLKAGSKIILSAALTADNHDVPPPVGRCDLDLWPRTGLVQRVFAG